MSTVIDTDLLLLGLRNQAYPEFVLATMLCNIPAIVFC